MHESSKTPTTGWRNPGQVSTGRSLTLMGIGAAVGLILAGYALFTARGTSTLYVPADAVALVNQQPISRLDYEIQVQTLFGVDPAHASVAQRKKVLDEMIREELLVQRGKELDVASSDPEVRAALVSAVEGEIAADAVTSNPSEAKLRSYYDAHGANFESEGVMSVHDYVFPESAAKAAADAAVSLRESGGSSAALEALKNQRSSKVGLEEFYFAAKIHLGDRLFAIASDMSDGQTSNPILMADGIHVLYMVKNSRPVRRSFDTARDLVLRSYRADASTKLTREDEVFLLKRANILIAGDMR